MADQDGTGYIPYDYKEVHACGHQLSFYLDCYESFGWFPDGNLQGQTAVGLASGLTETVLFLKRSRWITNKTELIRLQTQFEACLEEIERLERSVQAFAVGSALAVGLIGAGLMAAAVMFLLAQTLALWISVTVMAPGCVILAGAYFVHKKAAAGRTRKVTPYIEKKYNEIYELCEKGHMLLFGTAGEV